MIEKIWYVPFKLFPSFTDCHFFLSINDFCKILNLDTFEVHDYDSTRLRVWFNLIHSTIDLMSTPSRSWPDAEDRQGLEDEVKCLVLCLILFLRRSEVFSILILKYEFWLVLSLSKSN